MGRRLVVVEDEPTVREARTVLLGTWGAEAQAVADIASLQQWLATPGRSPPDLLIVDDRVSQGRTGIEALAALRARSAEARAAGHGGHGQQPGQPRGRGRPA